MAVPEDPTGYRKQAIRLANERDAARDRLAKISELAELRRQRLTQSVAALYEIRRCLTERTRPTEATQAALDLIDAAIAGTRD